MTESYILQPRYFSQVPAFFFPFLGVLPFSDEVDGEPVAVPYFVFGVRCRDGWGDSDKGEMGGMLYSGEAFGWLMALSEGNKFLLGGMEGWKGLLMYSFVVELCTNDQWLYRDLKKGKIVFYLLFVTLQYI